MRVLVADRNARLLESIALTFSPRFSIHTATTLARCADFLEREAFDLVIVCEKLSDGPGLPLLGQIARHSPDTLRVFAAPLAKLQFLRGRLGPLGLFRTLPYPIDAGRLSSTLNLARAGLLDIDMPAPQIPAPELTASEVSRVPHSPPVSHPATRAPFSSGASKSQSIALTLARLQPPNLIPPRPQPPAVAPSRPIPTERPAPPVVARPRPPKVTPVATPPRVATARHTKSADAPPKHGAPLLGTAMVAVFLLTLLTLRQPFDTHSRPPDPPPALVTTPATFTPLRDPTPPRPTPSFAATRPVPKPLTPKPEPEYPMTTSNTPIADSSTFGTEAAEPIYAN